MIIWSTLPPIAGNGAERAAQNDGYAYGYETDYQRYAGTVYQAAKNIAAKLVCSHKMGGRGLLKGIHKILLRIVIGCYEIGKDGYKYQQNQYSQTKHGKLASSQPYPYVLHATLAFFGAG